MSKSYSDLREDFILNTNSPEYRHAYAEESLDLSVGTQIKVLREQRDWRQADLAQNAEIRQPMVSRYENVNYSNWSINTLKKLARAFDVWLDVRFRSFGELVTTTENFSRESLQVPKFSDDTYFWKKRTQKRRGHKAFHLHGTTNPQTKIYTGLFLVPPAPIQLGLSFESIKSPEPRTSAADAASRSLSGTSFNPPPNNSGAGWRLYA